MKTSKKRIRTTSLIQECARMLCQEMTPAEKLGYRVIRFQNEQVLHQLDQVLAAVQAA